MSKQYSDVWFYFFGGGGVGVGVGGGDKHVHEPKCGASRFFSVKKLNTAFCTSLGSTSRVFQLFDFVCGEKIIRLASKNSVKLGEKSTSDF